MRRFENNAAFYITKTCLFKHTEKFTTPKNENFLDKNSEFFL